MSDFTAALHHNPHPKPVRKPPQPRFLDDIAEAVVDAVFEMFGKTRTLTKSDFKLVA